MSKLILLPGNSVRNKEWIEMIQKEIGGEILQYEHWKTGAPLIDIEKETEALRRFAGANPIRIFAKSAGCLLAMRAARDNGLTIVRAVFVGTAVTWGREKGFAVNEWLAAWQVPTLFIQKEGDRAIPAGELQSILPRSGELYSLPGDDHDYMEMKMFIPKVKEFLNA